MIRLWLWIFPSTPSATIQNVPLKTGQFWRWSKARGPILSEIFRTVWVLFVVSFNVVMTKFCSLGSGYPHFGTTKWLPLSTGGLYPAGGDYVCTYCAWFEAIRLYILCVIWGCLFVRTVCDFRLYVCAYSAWFQAVCLCILCVIWGCMFVHTLRDLRLYVCAYSAWFQAVCLYVLCVIWGCLFARTVCDLRLYVCTYSTWFHTSTAMKMRSLLLSDVMQCLLIVTDIWGQRISPIFKGLLDLWIWDRYAVPKRR
jgi:hypothetical protein